MWILMYWDLAQLSHYNHYSIKLVGWVHEVTSTSDDEQHGGGGGEPGGGAPLLPVEHRQGVAGVGSGGGRAGGLAQNAARYIYYIVYIKHMWPRGISCNLSWSIIWSGQVETHFKSLAQKVEEAKVGVLAQLAKQVGSLVLFLTTSPSLHRLICCAADA